MTTATVPPPLVEQTIARLRQDLLSSVLRPGDKLKVDHLRAAYGCSSSPLREALNRLTHEGLVIADERRGFRVAPMSVEDFNDITRMRLILDIQALEESMAVGGDEWETQSVAAFYRLQKVEERLPDGPTVLDGEWTQRHKDFHMTLLSATMSPRLLRNCGSLFDQAERYRRLSAAHRCQPRSKSGEHEAILNATLGRNRREATALLAGHITRTQQDIAALLPRLTGEATASA
ncbi:GntR family transcriptional regulator [Gordonia sp. zg691]|uniref:GntR family transcriptional regulator n=1 Tax=Gordonia jinghuaiqii TaxID=2758710 RepID=UPI00166259D2|nr:GntR family transcriptional regulator [Gordonia jinghuaiqii]MBD0862601.1 GntR family transcriptional regulator [Gordonia jinghuaiqii]